VDIDLSARWLPPGLLELVAPVRESLVAGTTATVPGVDDSGAGPTTTTTT